jgi:hypothetical protein
MKFRAEGYFFFLVVFSLLLFPKDGTWANSLTGEFTFNTKIPEVALVYFSEDKSLRSTVEPVIDQVEKEFVPTLVVGAKGSRLVIKNSDTLNHNTYALDQKLKVSFDTDLAGPGVVSYQTIDWAENNVVKIGCKIHPTMRAWVACISSRYYKVVEFTKGKARPKFEIKDVPDNLTQVKVWLPRYLPAEVVIKKGESKKLELKKKTKVSGTLTLGLR